MTKQRITMVSIIGLLVFGLLLGSQIIYQKKWVDADLIASIEDIPGVESAEIVTVNGVSELQVNTAQVVDVKQLAGNLEREAAGMTIKIIDSRDERLVALYEQMQFAIQEGIARGNFIEMADFLHGLAVQNEVELYLTIDSRNIYLSLTAGEQQLISVIERNGQGIFASL